MMNILSCIVFPNKTINLIFIFTMVIFFYSEVALLQLGHYASINYALIAMLIFTISCILWMIRNKSFSGRRLWFCLNLIHRSQPLLRVTKKMLENLADSDIPIGTSQEIRRIIGYINGVIENNNSVMAIGAEKPGGNVRTNQYELSTYITSLTSHCREYADSRHVKLNVRNDTGYIGCSINEAALTAALQCLVEKVIVVTPPDGCVNVIVSCLANQWKLEISNFQYAEKDCKWYFGVLFALVKIYCCGYLRLINRIIRYHGGAITGYEQGKFVHYDIVVPIAYRDKKNDNPLMEIRPETAKLPHVMLMMGDKEFSGYLKESLSGCFRVSVCEDSVRLLRSLSSRNTDIVIVDDTMYGIKLCSQIKSDKKMSDIPVVMLMDLEDGEDSIASRQSGADWFLPRMVQMERLSADIQALIEERIHQSEQLKKLVEKNFSSRLPHCVTRSEADAEFLEELNKVLHKHLAEEKYSVIKLAEEMKMCRTKLYNRVLEITQVSPLDYMHLFRLERAVLLLLTQQYQVGEVATMVGYNTSKYFGRRFKSYFDDSPTDYVKKVLNGEIQMSYKTFGKDIPSL